MGVTLVNMNVALLPSIKAQMEQEISAGNYDTENDLVNAALSYFLSCDFKDPFPPEEMKRLLKVGADQADRGETLPFDDTAVERIKAEGRRLLAMRGRK